MQQGARQGQPLRLPAREITRRGLLPSAAGPRAPAGRHLRLAILNTVHAREEVQVLRGGQLLVEHWLVAEVSNAPPDVLRVAAKVETINRDLASAGTRERRQNAQQRGLARAVGAEQRHRRASGNRQRDAAQHRLELERLAHIARNYGLCHFRLHADIFAHRGGEVECHALPPLSVSCACRSGARSRHARLLAFARLSDVRGNRLAHSLCPSESAAT